MEHARRSGERQRCAVADWLLAYERRCDVLKGALHIASVQHFFNMTDEV
jgi:hypothetical protein